MQLNAKTVLCGIIGNPVAHSISPEIHNAGYGALGLNWAYLAFEVEDLEGAICGMKALGIRGLSVTVPHKTEVLDYLDDIDDMAQKIGAVNTVVNDGGRLTGYNTDWDGCVRAIEEVRPIQGSKVVVVGAGGAGRAIVFGMKKRGCGKLTILNRTVDRAQELAEEVGADEFGGQEDLEKYEVADIIINATSVGMEPNIDSSPVPLEALKEGATVHDIVYKPRETKLARDAMKVGATVVTGDKMLFFQAIRQFELFTGKNAPVEKMRKALNQALS